MKKNQYRQGDILLERVETIPENLKEKDRILAWGETTGHYHKLKGDCKVVVDTSGRQYVEAGAGTVLVHQEHGQIQIQKGKYAVLPQREYAVSEGIRRVMD